VRRLPPVTRRWRRRAAQRLGAASLGVALAIVAVVSLLSGVYPAIIATRVTPLEAMQSGDD